MRQQPTHTGKAGYGDTESPRSDRRMAGCDIDSEIPTTGRMGTWAQEEKVHLPRSESKFQEKVGTSDPNTKVPSSHCWGLSASQTGQHENAKKGMQPEIVLYQDLPVTRSAPEDQLEQVKRPLQKRKHWGMGQAPASIKRGINLG